MWVLKKCLLFIWYLAA